MLGQGNFRVRVGVRVSLGLRVRIIVRVRIRCYARARCPRGVFFSGVRIRLGMNFNYLILWVRVKGQG